MRGLDSPCGLCLSTNSICEIFLLSRAGTLSIDQTKSHCPNLRSFQLKKAEEFSIRQPCTNYPLSCPICPRGTPAVWKYNLRAHILTTHPLYNAELHEPIWRRHPDEDQLMKAEWEKLRRSRQRPSKETSTRKLKVSDGHSSRLALRYVFDISCCRIYLTI